MFGDLLGAEVESYNVVRHLRAGRGGRERGGGRGSELFLQSS